MVYREVLKKCVGTKVVINNDREMDLVQVDDDFIVLQGGNTQMKITEFIPILHIIRVIRADYTATGDSSISLDVSLSGGDQKRSGH